VVLPKGLLQKARDGLRDIAAYPGGTLFGQPPEDGVDAQEADTATRKIAKGKSAKRPR
jgi:hypothetical protein